MRTFLVLLGASVALLGFSATAPAAGGHYVTGVVGPGFTISLSMKGKKVKVLAPGRYTFVISDKSSLHNFHLIGPGVNKKTSVAKTGKYTWHLVLRKGTYRYICDPHKAFMKGQFVVKTP